MSDAAVESAKRAAAEQAVKDHFDPSATNVGIGSGTTIVYVVDAIKKLSTNPAIRFIPTGYQSRQVIVKAGLTPVACSGPSSTPSSGSRLFWSSTYNKTKAAPDRMVQGGPGRPARATLVRRGAEPDQLALGWSRVT